MNRASAPATIAVCNAVWRAALLAQVNGNAGEWTSKYAARFSGYSLSHLRLAFLQAADGTLADGLRRLRLSQAAVQLAAGATVTQASLDAGFQTPESFGKAFRRAFCTTPSAFASGQTQGVLHARAARLAVAFAAALSTTPHPSHPGEIHHAA